MTAIAESAAIAACICLGSWLMVRRTGNKGWWRVAISSTGMWVVLAVGRLLGVL